MITLVLIYPDSSTWIVGGFSSMDTCNAWIASDKAQSSYQPGTQYQITQVTIVDSVQQDPVVTTVT